MKGSERCIGTDGHHDRKHLEKLEHVDFRPIFVLGLHRSGTSILCKMLCATGNFNPVTAYHLIRYSQILDDHAQGRAGESRRELTREFKQKGLEDRGIDELQPSADFPEEYGFLLGQHTSQMRITSANVPVFTELCKKIQCVSGNGRPVLLRNPYDFSNFVYIKSAFPNARFVFIHRHPFRTLSSAIQAVKLLLTNRNEYVAELWDAYGEIFRNPLRLRVLRFLFFRIPVVGAIWLTVNASRATKYYLRNIGYLAREDYVSITYEQLCQTPTACIATIMESLGVEADNTVNTASLIKPRDPRLDPSVSRIRRLIYRTMKSYFSAYGYNSVGSSCE